MNKRILLAYLLLLAFLFLTSLGHKAAIEDEDIPQEVEESIENQEVKQEKEQNHIPGSFTEDVPANPSISYCNIIIYHNHNTLLFSLDVKKYNQELVWGVVFLVTLVMFSVGRSSNDNLAQNWKKACSGAISSNFAHFGVTKEPSTNIE